MNIEQLIHEVSAKVDNTNSPKKPSDKKAYNNGFAECYKQVMGVLESKKLPAVAIGQKLYACLGWDGGKIVEFEVSPGANKRSLLLRAYEDDGTFHLTTGHKYKDIGTRLFFTEKEAKEHPIK